MTVTTPLKTSSVVLIPHTFVLHPDTVLGSVLDVTTKRSIVIFLYHGYVQATADTNPGKFKVQVRPDDGAGAVDEHWQTVAEYVVVGSTPSDEQMDAVEAADETVLAVTLTAGFAADDLLYIHDTDGGTPVATTQALAGDELNSEWAECQLIVTDVSVDIVDGLTNAKDTDDIIYNDASKFVCALDLSAIESLRVVWSQQGAVGADCHVKVLGITYDSDSSI